MTDQHWAPDRIWLQREQGDHGSHTWCEDSVGDGDMIEEAEYVLVRADGEPVAHVRAEDLESLKDARIAGKGCFLNKKARDGFVPIYAAPLPASANRLTDEQILAIAWKYHYDEPDASGYDFGTPSLLEFARAIIAATEAK